VPSGSLDTAPLNDVGEPGRAAVVVGMGVLARFTVPYLAPGEKGDNPDPDLPPTRRTAGHCARHDQITARTIVLQHRQQHRDPLVGEGAAGTGLNRLASSAHREAF
jgi:hypothetical protein